MGKGPKLGEKKKYNLPHIFIYVTTAKKIFGYILTLISCMTKSPENPDSVKNHKHSSSVFPHHCRMVLEYLM